MTKPQIMKKAPPFPTPNVAVDTVLCTIIDNQVHVLMIQIGSGVLENYWALPGGLVHVDESLDAAAKRVLFEKAHAENIYLEQLYAFGAVDRDPRSRTISVAYYALINDADMHSIHKGQYYKDTQWFPIHMLPTDVAFDHTDIIAFAHNRLKETITQPKTLASLLPKRFTLSRLQRIHEIILEQEIDKRNFRKKLLALDLVTKTKEKEDGMAHRPAWLYEFNPHSSL